MSESVETRPEFFDCSANQGREPLQGWDKRLIFGKSGFVNRYLESKSHIWVDFGAQSGSIEVAPLVQTAAGVF